MPPDHQSSCPGPFTTTAVPGIRDPGVREVPCRPAGSEVGLLSSQGSKAPQEKVKRQNNDEWRIKWCILQK